MRVGDKISAESTPRRLRAFAGREAATTVYGSLVSLFKFELM
jgi:hypothetical protein